MCNECEEMAREGNLGLSGVAALISGRCESKPKNPHIDITLRSIKKKAEIQK